MFAVNIPREHNASGIAVTGEFLGKIPFHLFLHLIGDHSARIDIHQIAAHKAAFYVPKMEIRDAPFRLARLHGCGIHRLRIDAIAPHLDVQHTFGYRCGRWDEFRIGDIIGQGAFVPFLGIEEHIALIVHTHPFHRQHLQLADGAVIVARDFPREAAKLRDALGRLPYYLRRCRTLAVESKAVTQTSCGYHIVTADVIQEAQHHAAQGRHLAAQPFDIERVTPLVSPLHPLSAGFGLTR